jgi:hypothetical protein
MFKAVASQPIGAQMISATDGSEFTGSVTCYVTKDGGSQAAGNTGAGACVHEGHGFHTYVADATDSNGDHIGFTFVGAGAVTATVQVYTNDKLASDALNASAKSILYGTVGNGSDTTHVVCSAVNMAGNTSVGTNALAGRRVYFLGNTTTANLRDAGGRITANTSGTTPTLTINASDTLPATPANGDTFVIL